MVITFYYKAGWIGDEFATVACDDVFVAAASVDSRRERAETVADGPRRRYAQQ